MAKTRAEINRANAQKSTGPKTPEGQARSSQNAFKHGLYAREVLMDCEDPARFDALRADLRREHQPLNTTEEILVDELAQHYWRLCRLRRFDVQAWTTHNFDKKKSVAELNTERLHQFMNSGMLEQLQRLLASAERGFHKALATLRQLQKDRGFVPSKQAEPAESPVLSAESSTEHDAAPLATTPEPEPERFCSPAVGFVPTIPEALPVTPGETMPDGLLPFARPGAKAA